MSDITIHITGIQETLNRLNGTRTLALRGALNKAGIYIRGVAATYPPRRIPSAYVRTRTLGKRWAVKMESDTRVRVGNNTPYAPYVMDDQLQTRVMKRRDWKTIGTIAREEKANVIKLVEADLKARLRRM